MVTETALQAQAGREAHSPGRASLIGSPALTRRGGIPEVTVSRMCLIPSRGTRPVADRVWHQRREAGDMQNAVDGRLPAILATERAR